MTKDTNSSSSYKELHQANNAFREYFLNDSSESVAAYRQVMTSLAETIAEQVKGQQQPYSGKSPADLVAGIAALDIFPEHGDTLQNVLDRTKELVIESNISVYHPYCLAHLHCPTFIASLAAEMIISAFNQSMDSWDQAPAATMIEQALCDKLCEVYGFGADADATFTGGGTMSNFMGLLLARDHYSQTHFNWNIQLQGLPAEASRFRIICAEHAHFTIAQSASILGLGAHAVVKIANEGLDEEVAALENTILSLKEQGLLPIAYVTTVGTTDFGSIGAIGQLADCAHKHGLWIHVDAAYGGALMFSDKHKYKLHGIETVDSVTIDFHKLFYQPISCGAFIVKDKAMFNYIKLHAAYLNPESNEELGILDLVSKSIQTTRRFDALKPFIALQHIGVKKFGEMLDHTIALADEVSNIIDEDPQLQLAYKTPINAVVFRYVPGEALSDAEADAINSDIKIKLLLSGKAIIGQTAVYERAYLKFTLLNPMTSVDQVVDLLNEIKEMGAVLEAAYMAVCDNETVSNS
ncbi:MAG: L-2,4-diaminobutyrate decarboxylase [Flavipsychrobacter sp.]|nr:L-2,4-diaminobutyrate decarboxylase [Flavipsychrobacter sp.]